MCVGGKMKIPQDMLASAKAVLPHAYAPYSHYQVAACVKSESGQLFVGCNVENASYSMTLCAESGAISALFAAGFKRVTETLILVSSKKLCAPCGACRQRLLECANPVMIPYGDLPDFPPCTVAGHSGNLIIGELHHVPVAFLQGRAHFYEGISN